MASRMRSNIRLLDAIDRYMSKIDAEGQSEKSQYTARYALRRFAKALPATNPYLHMIGEDDIDRYFYGPQGIRRGAEGQGLQAVSFNRYRSVLKVFFDYGVQMRWVDTNPVANIVRARPDAPKSRLMLNAGELLSLLDHCTIPVERIACSIGMNTGLRGNDVRHLTVFDASIASGVIQTEIRKTRKLDVKPITMELHWELTKWLNTYAELMGCSREDMKSDWLLVPSFHYFPIRGGEPQLRLRPSQVHQAPWRMVQRPLHKMGYPTRGEGFHTLRRSSARALFESLRDAGEGRDHALMIVKEFLNHASTSQTEHYLGLNQERAIRDALMKDKPFLSALAKQEQRRVANGGVA